MVSNERESKANVAKVDQEGGVESVNGAATGTYYLNNIKEGMIKELTRSCSNSRQWENDTRSIR